MTVLSEKRENTVYQGEGKTHDGSVRAKRKHMTVCDGEREYKRATKCPN